MSETALDKVMRFFSSQTSLWKTADEAAIELAQLRAQAARIIELENAVEEACGIIDDVLACAQYTAGSYMISGALWDAINLSREKIAAPPAQPAEEKVK